MSAEAIAALNNNHPSARSIRGFVKEALWNGEVLALEGRRGIQHVDTRRASAYAKLCLGLLCDAREHDRLLDFSVNLLTMTGISFAEKEVSVMLQVMASHACMHACKKNILFLILSPSSNPPNISPVPFPRRKWATRGSGSRTEQLRLTLSSGRSTVRRSRTGVCMGPTSYSGMRATW
jgi:hypothetical protein